MVQAPRNRKEAVRLQREQAKERRRDARKAMMSGDDRYLTPRDRGPVRAFVRDFVDSRRNLTAWFIPATFLVFILGASPVPAMQAAANAVLVTVIVVVIMDSMRLSRTVVSEVQKRFPNEPTKGLKMYAVMRAMQFRRMRMPKARVKVGDPV
jgi:hypothetical protein